MRFLCILWVFQVITLDSLSFTEKMAKKKNPQVYMDVCIDGDPAETMVFEVQWCLTMLMFLFFLYFPGQA